MTPAIVTIGNFDGVHRGHQHVIAQAVARARALGLRSFAVSFFPHPETVLRPGASVSYLTDPDEKVWLIRQLGVGDVWVCPFTRELSQLGPAEFMALVAERQPIAELWVGSDFALGRDRAGTLSVLAEIGGARGWAVHMVPPFRLDGEVVSSTAIRGCLAGGDMQRAAELLGRQYSLCGRVERGASAGSTVRIPADRAIPAAGTYAARVRLPDSAREAIATVFPGNGGSRDPHVLQLAPIPPGASLPDGEAAIAFVERLAAAGPDDEGLGSDTLESARRVLAGTVPLGPHYLPCRT